MKILCRFRIADPSRDIRRCPAIKLAVKRTQRVTGRIMFLVISIMTIKFISPVGVPCGSKWESMCFGVLNHPYIIIDSHTEKARGRLIDRWAVLENRCGYKAMKFKGRIVISRRIRILWDLWELFPKVYSVSFFMVFVTVVIGMDGVFDNFHGEILNKAGIVIRISHLVDHIDAAGSNIENRFVIIFIWVVFFWFGFGFLVYVVVSLFLLVILLLRGNWTIVVRS